MAKALDTSSFKTLLIELLCFRKSMRPLGIFCLILLLTGISASPSCLFLPCPEEEYCVFRSDGDVGCIPSAKLGETCTGVNGGIGSLYFEYPPCDRKYSCDLKPEDYFIVGTCKSHSSRRNFTTTEMLIITSN
ncbi:hypothetical protein CEXT_142581 [Caerostris extrusa]|uniref:Uncharacterized protein n=1 Tax=Caerostris extrusa TaxID=172846 RepID=A0AAV4NXK5_CAEEX|nr:hypothetical protein CEXT_142581 [Caerostris extrusa]